MPGTDPLDVDGSRTSNFTKDASCLQHIIHQAAVYIRSTVATHWPHKRRTLQVRIASAQNPCTELWSSRSVTPGSFLVALRLPVAAAVAAPTPAPLLVVGRVGGSGRHSRQRFSAEHAPTRASSTTYTATASIFVESVPGAPSRVSFTWTGQTERKETAVRRSHLHRQEGATDSREGIAPAGRSQPATARRKGKAREGLYGICLSDGVARGRGRD